MKMIACALALTLCYAPISMAADDSSAQFKSQLRDFADQSSDVLLGTDDGQDPNSTARLVTRRLILQAHELYHEALKIDLAGSQALEDVTQEVTGAGIISGIKYTPGLAVVVPLSVITLRRSREVLRYAFKAPMALIRDAVSPARYYLSGKLIELSKAPFRYVRGLSTLGAFPVFMGSLTALASYHMYSMYLSKPEYDQLVSNNEQEIQNINAEVSSIGIELSRRSAAKK